MYSPSATVCRAATCAGIWPLVQLGEHTCLVLDGRRRTKDEHVACRCLSFVLRDQPDTHMRRDVLGTTCGGKPIRLWRRARLCYAGHRVTSRRWPGDSKAPRAADPTESWRLGALVVTTQVVLCLR